jgi:putative transposase
VARHFVNVKVDTFIGWRRKGFRLFWRSKSKPTGRPRLPKPLRELIRQMAADDVSWGEERIARRPRVELLGEPDLVPPSAALPEAEVAPPSVPWRVPPGALSCPRASRT